MSQEQTKAKSKNIAATVIALLFCVVLGCVSPDAVKTDIQGVRNDMGKLEKIIDQKADNTVVAEYVNEINNRIEQTAQIAEELSLWKKNVQAETINYGGAGWVVVGTGVMALIFLGAGGLLIRLFIRRGTMLSMLTGAVKRAGEESPYTVQHIKRQLKECVHEGDFKEVHRQSLGNFAKKVGTFSKQK